MNRNVKFIYRILKLDEWNELKKNDDIYLSKYSGWYSVSDEAFYAEDEIEEF